MTMKFDGYYILWQATCRVTGEANVFYIVDEGDDAHTQCPFCSSELDVHNYPETDQSERACKRCQGEGKITLRPTDKMKFDCYMCRGTGIEKLDHTKILVGRLHTADLVMLAKKDPQGWH